MLLKIGLSVWVIGLVVVFLNWLFKTLDWGLHVADVTGDAIFRWTGLIGLGFIVLGIGVEALRHIWKRV